jgi:hypothetical protein
MQSIGKFLRPAQGDAVTAIDLVGVIRSRSVMTRRNQSTGKTVGATHQHPRRNVRLPLEGRGFVHARFGLAPPARQASMSASYRRQRADPACRDGEIR